MATYRVFVTRHYIAVRWYDVEAPTPAKARRLAERVARKQVPDARQEATDNGWIADEPTAIPYIGVGLVGHYNMQQVDFPNATGNVYEPTTR
jgi:hypothetical protein